MNRILHLSHTNINSDSRILKEMNSIAKLINISNLKINGIGVDRNEGSADSENLNNLIIDSVSLQSKRLFFLPVTIIHMCCVLELTTKMLFKAVRFNPKIVHCHDTTVLPVGFIIKFITGAKLIYDAHELESNRNGLTKFLGKLTLFTEKILWKSIDALIVVSPSIEKWYKGTIGDKYSQIILNAPYIIKDNLIIGENYLRKKFLIEEKSKIFIYIGIFGKGRGIELVIEAFKNPDINSSLVFLGFGDATNELKKLSSKHKNIYVHDAVAHEQVVPIAKSADIGLCLIQNISLSDYFCLPNKLFEYSFSGLPVLASRFPDISALVKKYNLGICCDLDSKSIYRAIKEFEVLGEFPKIDTNLLYELSWGAQEKKLLELYESIIIKRGQ